MHSLKGETSVADGSRSESSVSSPSTSFEPDNISEHSQSRNVELCETLPTSSDTQSDSATGNFQCILLGAGEVCLHFILKAMDYYP